MKLSFAKSEMEPIRPPIRMVILFENEIACDEARNIADHLLGRVRFTRRLETFCWNLQPLIELECLIAAITMADILIVSGNCHSALPTDIKSALKFGLSSKRRTRGAVVALLGQNNIEDRKPSALHLLLQEIADATGQDFFPGAFKSQQENHDYFLAPGEVMEAMSALSLSPEPFSI